MDLKQTRFYLDIENLGLIKLCWFRENKEYEMIFSFYGLSSQNACFARQYEDRYVTKEELLKLRINYKDAELRQKGEIIDHFIIHKDGKFHLKLIDESERYVHKVKLLTPINDKIGEFLDFFIISDVASKYKQFHQQPENPYVSIPVKPTNFVILRGRFSGANFNLEQVVIEEEIPRFKTKSIIFPAVSLEGKIFKGIFTCEIMDSKGVNFSNRPEGTYMLMTFPVEVDKFLVKAFVFN